MKKQNKIKAKRVFNQPTYYLTYEPMDIDGKKIIYFYVPESNQTFNKLQLTSSLSSYNSVSFTRHKRSILYVGKAVAIAKRKARYCQNTMPSN